MGGAIDIEEWSRGLVARAPAASKYGKLHLDYAAAFRQTQLTSFVIDAVTATFLLRSDKADSDTGRALLFDFREYLTSFNEVTNALDERVIRLIPRLQHLLDCLKPENRKPVVEAVFRLGTMERASMSWLTKTVSDAVCTLKLVNNTNFLEAVRLLNVAVTPRLRGRGRAQLTEIKYEPQAKVSGSSIQTSSFVCV